jgi:hypothetical protein
MQLADALAAFIPPADDGLVGDFQAATGDRVLRIVRRLCREYEAPDLWRRIACLVLDLDQPAKLTTACIRPSVRRHDLPVTPARTRRP